MKNILSLLLLITSSFSYSQNEQSSLVGEWKVISLDTGDFYLNTISDSISISEEFKKIFSDSLEMINLIDVTRDTYANNIIEFKEDGTYINSKINSSEATYEVIQLKQKIHVMMRKNVKFEMDYKIMGNLLHLIINTYSKKTNFILSKIQR